MAQLSPDYGQDRTLATDAAIEHYCTLFDKNYLPMGLSLHASLESHAAPFHLCVVCMDEEVKEQLNRLSRKNLTAISLKDVEGPDLLSIKSTRTWQEYCWTVKPFSIGYVIKKIGNIKRVTYLDSDLFFLGNPSPIFRDFDGSGKSIMVTDHAFAPEYDVSSVSGRFCAQFMTFCPNEAGLRVLDWWRTKCIECCSAIPIDGKFGDQVYIDQWPTLFGNDLNIVPQVEKTLAPWNVSHLADRLNDRLDPIFYHFHGFRIVEPDRVRTHTGYYYISKKGMVYYDQYLAAIRSNLKDMHDIGIPTPYMPLKRDPLAPLRRVYGWLIGRRSDSFARIGL
jgi:hypothetical protein